VAEKGNVGDEKAIEKQPHILRLTTPKLKNVWGFFRSGSLSVDF
jgi:hypothetical protein